MTDSANVDLAALYRDTRQRLTGLVAQLGDDELATIVPCCPRWSVRDVVAHLTSIPEDALEGRLAGIPTEDQSAEQVARFAGVAMPNMLARWSEAAPEFEPIINAFTIWPAVIDVASHEQDIRCAIRRTGGRDCAAITACTPFLLNGLTVPVPLRVLTEHGTYLAGPEGPTELTLSTSRFEAFRWRMGRRSRAQLAAMDWSADPSAVLDHLTVFGPAVTDIHE